MGPLSMSCTSFVDLSPKRSVARTPATYRDYEKAKDLSFARTGSGSLRGTSATKADFVDRTAEKLSLDEASPNMPNIQHTKKQMDRLHVTMRSMPMAMHPQHKRGTKHDFTEQGKNFRWWSADEVANAKAAATFTRSHAPVIQHTGGGLSGGKRFLAVEPLVGHIDWSPIGGR